jgi:hypothetical protein
MRLAELHHIARDQAPRTDHDRLMTQLEKTSNFQGDSPQRPTRQPLRDAKLDKSSQISII